MPDLGLRTATAVLYGAVVLVAVLAPPAVFVVAVAVMALLALAELYALRRAGLPALLELLLLAAAVPSLIFLRLLGDPSGALLGTIVATWAADVAAYLVGSEIGRRKIAPRISPGKTWEGTLGGFAAAAVVAIAVWGRGPIGVALALTLGPAAFGGDLLESWLKRRAGVKDSGTLLPGHGGILDRVDALLATGPLVGAVVVLLGRMG